MRRRYAIGGLTVLALVALGAGAYWHRFVRLSAAERAVVGCRALPLTLDVVAVTEYRPDRTVRMAVFGADGHPMPGEATLTARWWVEGETLVVDYETRPTARLTAWLRVLTGGRRARGERLGFEVTPAGELRLAVPGGRTLVCRPVAVPAQWPDE